MTPVSSVSKIILGFFVCLFFILIFNLCWANNNHELNKIRLSAENGDLQAQYLLGSLYYYGEVVKRAKDIDYKGEPLQRDWKEAAKWFQKPAEQGHVYSQFFLGDIYEAQFLSETIFERDRGLPYNGIMYKKIW